MSIFEAVQLQFQPLQGIVRGTRISISGQDRPCLITLPTRADQFDCAMEGGEKALRYEGTLTVRNDCTLDRSPYANKRLG